jgi:hypothetical protein
MRLIPKSRIGCSITAAVSLAALGLLVLLAHYRILAVQEALKASDYSEAYYHGQSTKWWVTQLDGWYLDDQSFVGPGTCVTIWYPRDGKPGPDQSARVGSNERESNTPAKQLPLVLSGDAEAEPVLLAMLRARRDYEVHKLAIYGLVLIKDKTPEIKAALASVMGDERDVVGREIIKDVTPRVGSTEPIKIILGGQPAPEKK